MTNQRAHTRHPIALAVELRVEGRRFTAVTRNVSAGGCCIEGAYRLEENAQVQAALYVVVDGVEEASLPPLEVRASVQWTAENEDGSADARHIAGLKFAGLGDAQRGWLEDVIARSEG